MTIAQIQSLAEEYNCLQKLLDMERSKPDASSADLGYSFYENKMARIETQFQKADLDIDEWI